MICLILARISAARIPASSRAIWADHHAPGSGQGFRWHWQVLMGYNVAMLFIVIEHYRHGPEPVYQRAAEQGRMLPDGLRYIDSWIVDDGRLDRCYQLMETSNPELLGIWRDRWADLCDFEIIPVIKSDEAARRTGVRWDTPGG